MFCLEGSALGPGLCRTAHAARSSAVSKATGILHSAAASAVARATGHLADAPAAKLLILTKEIRPPLHAHHGPPIRRCYVIMPEAE